MLKKMRNNKLKIVLVLFLVLLLAIVRAYEDELFYDPFLSYYRGDYLSLPFPEFDGFQLFLGLTFRYFLNTIISLGIIQILFSDLKGTKFAAILYFLLYWILIGALFLVLHFFDKGNNFILFYIRRFLIQPLFLLLFVPAFFYQKQNK
ncbi:exosortase F system-associated membrane protein [Flavobacterium psychrotolerans]|uniref:Exosortase F system-associated protein n=2 Tax=Flavobacterium psychrotolerans TaxID=2169410 RepID=A0A2U1JNP4_9FLAO|nr:exosortase F system-associated protein [Flavobacterium psychrotolerans]